MDVSSYLVYGIPALAVVIGVVKIAQESGLPSKYAPAASLVSGIGTGVVMAQQNGDPIAGGIVAGIVIGCTACGVYDLGKKTTTPAVVATAQTSAEDQA
ncbi:MAG TPA: hypothetical protein VN426_06215 [Syntrophomonadaceae bacterium]|nr:hypothetical protein [Syntrophomonadaceae bacterium]